MYDEAILCNDELGVAGDGGSERAGRDEDDQVACEPLLAEVCWADVATHIDCLLNPRSVHSQDCRRPNATELCG